MTGPERPVAPSISRPPQRVFHPFTFGKYYLIDRIGTGGMAEVFRALPVQGGPNPLSENDVLVIKRILPHIAENEDFVDMFADEAKITAALRHPNVVRVFDFGRVHHDSYIAMEYVEGKDLRNVLRRLAHRERFLELSLCAAIAHEVCRGLHYAHTLADDQGVPYDVVHRDVSPANVLLSYTGEIKLTDFGVAKASSNANRTKSGIFKGKFDYMSPEQAEGRDIDQRADIFAAGILLFEMITCRRLFKADSEIATLQKIRESKIPSMGHYRPGVDPELEAICLKALSRDRDDRYPSADAMADALRAFIAPGSVEASRERLAELLEADFPTERAAEEQRLTKALQTMPVATGPRLEANWDGSTPSTLPDRGTASNQSLRSALTGAVAMAVLLVVIGSIAFAVRTIQPQWLQGWATDQAPTSEGLTAAAASGIEVVVDPPGRVEIDGIPRGEGSHLIIDSLEPGLHALKVMAPGFRPHEAEISVEQGLLTPMMIRLDRDANAPVIAGDIPTDPSVPAVTFRSTPTGAAIFVNGTRLGVTPLLWTNGKLGGAYSVEMRLKGHLDAATELQLAPGSTVISLDLGTTERQLLDPQGEVLGPDGIAVVPSEAVAEEGEDEAAPAAAPSQEVYEAGLDDLVDPFADAVVPAKLILTVPTEGGADVYIDNVKLEARAPLQGQGIPPGQHTVRVVNPAVGLDWSTTKAFESGKSVTVNVPEIVP